MKRTRMWFIALVAVLALATACGPQMASPTARTATDAPGTAPTQAPSVGQTPVVTQPAATALPTVDTGSLPVDPNDWRALGPADAAVTVIEYSDFQ